MDKIAVEQLHVHCHVFGCIGKEKVAALYRTVNNIPIQCLHVAHYHVLGGLGIERLRLFRNKWMKNICMFTSMCLTIFGWSGQDKDRKEWMKNILMITCTCITKILGGLGRKELRLFRKKCM